MSTVKRIIILLIGLLIYSNKASSKYEHLLHKTYVERRPGIEAIMDSVMAYNTKSAATEIKILAETARKGNDEELMFEAELLEVWYGLTRDTIHWSNSKCEHRLISLLKKACEEGNLPFEIDISNKLGYFYFNFGQKYGQAFEYYLNMYNALQKASDDLIPQKNDLVYNIGVSYFHFGDYENARKFLYIAKNAIVENRTSFWCIVNIYNTLGLLHRNESEYDSAIYYFKQAAVSARKHNIDYWEDIAGGNIGITYFLQKKYEEAIPLLEKDVKVSLEQHATDNAANSLLKLAEISLLQGNMAKAEKQLVHAKQLVGTANKPYLYQPDLFRLLAALHHHNGNSVMAYKYADSSRIAKDTLTSKMNAVILARTQNKVETLNHLAEKQKLESEADTQHLVRNFLIIAMVLVSVIAVLFINRQKIRHKQLQAEKQHAEEELLITTRQLEEFTKHIQEKNKLIENFTVEIERLQALPCSNELPDTKDNLKKLQEATILTDEQWNDFRKMFDKVHTGFLDRMQEKLPHLTPAETRYIALSKLKLSNKEMASMIGVSLQGVRTYKYRLRKKLNLPEEGDMEELVNMI